MRGFTMIELMLAIVIIAIVVAVGAPSFNDLILSTRVKNAATDIYGTLIFARSEAVKRSTNVTITPVDGLWVNGWTVTVNISGTDVTLKAQDAVSSLKIECPSGTDCDQTVVYRRDGRVNAIANSLTFVVDEATPPATRRVAMRCVTVSPSGQINVLSDTNLDGNCNNG